MRHRGFAPGIACALAVTLCYAGLSVGAASAQSPSAIALKSGESVVVQSVWYVSQCRSIMIGMPEVEILEGPPELTLSVAPDKVLPRRLNCPNKVDGGTLTATAKDVQEPIHTQVTYRVKYKTRDGDRQVSHTYKVDLFP
jgi:hypothetical protein